MFYAKSIVNVNYKYKAIFYLKYQVGLEGQSDGNFQSLMLN